MIWDSNVYYYQQCRQLVGSEVVLFRYVKNGSIGGHSLSQAAEHDQQNDGQAANEQELKKNKLLPKELAHRPSAKVMIQHDARWTKLAINGWTQSAQLSAIRFRFLYLSLYYVWILSSPSRQTLIRLRIEFFSFVATQNILKRKHVERKNRTKINGFFV